MRTALEDIKAYQEITGFSVERFPDELMFTMAPPPTARMAGTAARLVRNTPSTLVDMTRCHSSSDVPSASARVMGG